MFVHVRLLLRYQPCFPLLRSPTSEICIRSMLSPALTITNMTNISDITAPRQWSCPHSRWPSIPWWLRVQPASTLLSPPDTPRCPEQRRECWQASPWPAPSLPTSSPPTWLRHWAPETWAHWTTRQVTPPPDLALQPRTWTLSTWAVLRSVELCSRVFLNHSHHQKWN